MSPITAILLAACVCVSWTQHHNEHHCYSCFHATSPENCTAIISCPHGKECFTTHYVYTPDGRTYYHLGCASHGACIHTDHFDPHTHDWIYPYAHDEVLCGHCCTAPGCNRLTCSHP